MNCCCSEKGYHVGEVYFINTLETFLKVWKYSTNLFFAYGVSDILYYFPY